MTLGKNKNICILIFFSLYTAFLFCARPCLATSADAHNTFLVMGSSRIYKDVMAARSAAISQCLLTAIERNAIETIPRDGLTKNFETITDLLATQQNTFISDYKVLKEITTDKSYRVLVQVTVSKRKMQEALAAADIVLSPENMPRILFLIAEQQADDISMQYWWRDKKSFFQSDVTATAIKQSFAAKNFPIIDDSALPPTIFKDMGVLTSELSDSQALEMGKRVNADIVLTGNAIASEMPNRIGKRTLTFKAIVNLRGLVTASGEEIIRASRQASSANQDISAGSAQALSEAGRQIGNALSKQIRMKWQEIIKDAGAIRLTIKGSDILPDLVLFRRELEKIQGVKSQQTLEMTMDEAILKVDYEGTSQSLADAIIMRTFDPFGINIYDLSENLIQIEFFAK